MVTCLSLEGALFLFFKLNKKFLEYEYLSFITRKSHEILLSGFRGVVLTLCFSFVFNFGQISIFERGIIPWEKNMIKMSCNYAPNALLHIMSLITAKFHEILLSSFSGVVLTSCFNCIFHFWKIFKYYLWKKPWIGISCKCAHLLSMSFIITKFYEILLNCFTGDVLTKNRTRGLTDRLTGWRTDQK